MIHESELKQVVANSVALANNGTLSTMESADIAHAISGFLKKEPVVYDAINRTFTPTLILTTCAVLGEGPLRKFMEKKGYNQKQIAYAVAAFKFATALFAWSIEKNVLENLALFGIRNLFYLGAVTYFQTMEPRNNPLRNHVVQWKSSLVQSVFCSIAEEEYYAFKNHIVYGDPFEKTLEAIVAGITSFLASSMTVGVTRGGWYGLGKISDSVSSLTSKCSNNFYASSCFRLFPQRLRNWIPRPSFTNQRELSSYMRV